MSFQLEAFLGEQRRRVDTLLQERMSALAAQVPQGLLEAMRYSLLDSGKRLRPILCLTFADATADSPTPGVKRIREDAACALEYVHTYSLIHDDLPAMDDDDLRRGRPTNHKVHGEAMAILAGDALLTEAFGLLASGEEPVRSQLCAELARAAGAAGMVGGQVLDIAQDRMAEEGYLNRLHRMKTGALIRAACRMGVLAAGGALGQVEAAGVFGEAVGLGFQIADDLLDVTSTPEAMGKPTGADAAAGRATYPSVLGLEGATAAARACVERARGCLANFPRQKEALSALAEYAVERRS